MVRYIAKSHKIDYIEQVLDILYPGGLKNCNFGLKVTAVLPDQAKKAKSSKKHKSKTIGAGDLKFFYTMFTNWHVSYVTCHLSCVTCLMSGSFFLIFFDKQGELVCGRSVISNAHPFYFFLFFYVRHVKFVNSYNNKTH